MGKVQLNELILCVEDEPDLLRDIVEELREAGYETISASNGQQALKQLGNHKVQLVLCDISMPGVDGFEVMRRGREQGLVQADTPFVFLSAANNPQDIAMGKRLGADDYLVKPIDYDVLLATIDARLRQVRRMRKAYPPVRPVEDLDWDVLAKRFGLTPAELRVASALVRGSSLAEITREQGVARSTVAFHLRNLFDKTDTRRQAELVALLYQVLASQGGL